MLKSSIYTFLIGLTLILSSCNSEVNSESILGTWTVDSVKITSDNVNFLEAHIHNTEKRYMTFTYTFLENDDLKVLDGKRNIEKGGDYILDEKRKVLTINETFNGLKVASVLWTIEMSTAESMTLFQDTPGKMAIRMTINKSR